MRRGSAALFGSEGQWSSDDCGLPAGAGLQGYGTTSLLHTPLSQLPSYLWLG